MTDLCPDVLYFLWWGQKLLTVPRQGLFPALFLSLLCESSGEINTERNLVVTLRTLTKDIHMAIFGMSNNVIIRNKLLHFCLRLLSRDKLNHIKMCQTECHTSDEVVNVFWNLGHLQFLQMWLQITVKACWVDQSKWGGIDTVEYRNINTIYDNIYILWLQVSILNNKPFVYFLLASWR